MDWLRPLLEGIGRLERAAGGGALDIEFAVSGRDVFLLQSRPLTAAAARSPARVARFKEVFFGFLLAEARKAGELGGLKARGLITGLKRLNCKFHLMASLHVTMQKYLEDRFIARHGEAWWKKNAAGFFPDLSFTAERLAGGLIQRKRRRAAPVSGRAVIVGAAADLDRVRHGDILVSTPRSSSGPRGWSRRKVDLPPMPPSSPVSSGSPAWWGYEVAWPRSRRGIVCV